MKTLFVAAGSERWASSRLRCYWPARHMADAAVVQVDDTPLPDAEAYIFQKTGFVELFRGLRARGRQVWLDVCDPMWWWQPDLFRSWAAHATGIVASSPALAADCGAFLGRAVHCIPDRLELSHFTNQAQHAERTPVRLVWFGLAVNRIALFAALANLERLAANGHKFELTICDDRPDDVWRANDFPIYHARWTLAGEVDVLAAHDLALLPPYPGPWGRVKSNNKTLTAWACGLPALTGEYYDELRGLMDSAALRRISATQGRADVLAHYLSSQSAAEWADLLGEAR